MIVDSVGDIVRFTLCACVKPAYDSLQLGELADHFGGKVALSQFRSAVGIGDMRLHHAEIEPLLHQPARDGADALDLVAIAAEAGFVSDLFELGEIVGEPTFLVGGPEELRVGEPRAQHAFMPGTHQAFGILG